MGVAAMAPLSALALASLLVIGIVSPALCKSSDAMQEDCRQGTYPPTDYPLQVPTHQLNLGLPAQHRWTTLVQSKAQEVRDLIAVIKSLVNAFSGGILIKLVDKELPKLIRGLPVDYVDEMQGIADAAQLPLGEVFLYNLFYEFNAFCTSIIAEDKAGNLYHARNLDFGLFLGWDIKNDTWLLTEKLRPIVTNLEFVRNGSVLFKTVNFIGYTGVLTGMKPHRFSLTINERYSLKGGFYGILKWVLGDHRGHWVGHLSRQVFESIDTFEEAKNVLSNDPLVAPIYFILGGNSSGEGAVLTRSADKTVDVNALNSKNGTWFVLETNYDRWKPPLFVDDRRTPATKCMNKLGQQNVAIAGIFDVLNTKPVKNKLTTYTALMDISKGTLETYLRFCGDPCWPW